MRPTPRGLAILAACGLGDRLEAVPDRDLLERLRAADVAMVGDDPKADVAAARRAGLRGILTLTGKTTEEEAKAGGARADAVARSLAEVVAALP